MQGVSSPAASLVRLRAEHAVSALIRRVETEQTLSDLGQLTSDASIASQFDANGESLMLPLRCHHCHSHIHLLHPRAFVLFALLYFLSVSAVSQGSLTKVAPTNTSNASVERMSSAVYLGCCFLALFTGFGSCQSLVARLLPGLLGTLNLSVIYYAFGVASFVAPLFVMKLHAKWTIFFGSLAYSAWIGSVWGGNTPAVLTMSALLGVGAALLWVRMGSTVR